MRCKQKSKEINSNRKKNLTGLVKCNKEIELTLLGYPLIELRTTAARVLARDAEGRQMRNSLQH